MSLDLYQRETTRMVTELRPASVPEPSVWDGFFRGAGMRAMRTFAEAGRAVDLLGAVGPIVEDAFTGGVEAQDRYFREHEELFGAAVEHWTLKPGEVGMAGEVTGQLLATLPMVIASPSFAVGQTQLSVAEDLARKGVEPAKAQAVGAVQAAGLGLGVWMPILGQNLWQRVVLGGAGFNLAQGVATRGASQVILEGTAATEDFKPWDPAMLTLDVLLGAAFGSLAHLSPTARAQGAAAWERLRSWGETLPPSQVEAIAALRQAQHLNLDSVGGTPASPVDLDLHVAKLRTAIDQLASDRRVDVSDLPAPKIEPDGRFAKAKARGDDLLKGAERVRAEEGLPSLPEAPPARGLSEEEIVSPVDRSAAPQEKVRQLEALSRENAPQVEAFLHRLDQQIGTTSKTSFKESAKILAKASRPSILKNKPWHDVEHVRDAFRFKTVLDNIEADLPRIAEAVREEGWEIVKVDVDKLMAPKEWGWQFVGLDLRMPNGQIVEYYMPVKEMESAKRAGNHQLFEKWRSRDTNALTPKQKIEYSEDLAKSQENYEAAMKDYAARTGATDETLRAAVANFSTSLGSMTREKLSLRSSAEGTKGVQVPSSKVPQTAGGSRTMTRRPSSDLETMSATDEILPLEELRGLETELAGGAHDPLAIEAARVVAERPDLKIVIGRDPDGTSQTVTARQFLEDARADVEQARQDARLFEVAAGCLLKAA